MKDTILSFWQHEQDLKVIRVFYFSYTDWEKILVADVDRNIDMGVVYITNGKTANKTQDILPFSDAVMNNCHIQGYRRLHHIGNDRGIIEQTYETIINHLSQMEENNEKYREIYNLKLHVESFLRFDYIYINGQTLTAQEIKDLLVNFYIVNFSNYGCRKSRLLWYYQ